MAFLPFAWSLFLLGSCLFPLEVFGDSFVEFGSTQLRPNQAGQTLTLFLVNEGPSPISIGGLDLALQVGNGETDPGNVLLKPAITALELVTGTIFDGFTPRLFADPGNQTFRQFWSVNIPPSGVFPEVPAHSQLPLAFITFDTTDLLTGRFALGLDGTLAGDTLVLDPFGLPLLENLVTGAELSVGIASSVPEGGRGSALLGGIAWALLLAHYGQQSKNRGNRRHTKERAK